MSDTTPESRYQPRWPRYLCMVLQVSPMALSLLTALIWLLLTSAPHTVGLTFLWLLPIASSILLSATYLIDLTGCSCCDSDTKSRTNSKSKSKSKQKHNHRNATRDTEVKTSCLFYTTTTTLGTVYKLNIVRAALCALTLTLVISSFVWGTLCGLGKIYLQPFNQDLESGGDPNVAVAIGWFLFLIFGGVVLVLGLTGLALIWGGALSVVDAYKKLPKSRGASDEGAMSMENIGVVGSDEQV